MKDSVVIIEVIVLLFLNLPLFSQIGGETKVFMFEVKNISTGLVEYSSTLSSSGTEIYFARSNQKWGIGNMISSIYYSFKKNDTWSSPELASFSGEYDDSDPHLSYDGNSLYFISKRPSDSIPVSADIWIVKKDKKGYWSNPMRLKSPLNSNNSEYSPRTDNKGNLYFASDRPKGYGQGDLYMAQKENDKLSEPINLGTSINSQKGEWNLEINGTGNIIVFEASERKQNVSSYGDLYISFKRKHKWSVPQNIKELNTTGSDLYAQFANNENTLFFTSSDSLKSVDTNIYYVEFSSILQRYRRQAIFLK